VGEGDRAAMALGVSQHPEEVVRARWASAEFKDLLTSVGFRPTPTLMTILELHAIEPPLS